MNKKYFLFGIVGCLLLGGGFLSIKWLSLSSRSERSVENIDDRYFNVLEKEAQYLRTMASSTPSVSSTIKTPFQKYQVHFGILMYHHVDNEPYSKAHRLSVTPQALDAQISFLLQHGYRFVTLNQALDEFREATTSPAHTLVLTFDDGYRSFYQNVLPLLKKYNVPASFYVIIQDIGNAGNVTWPMLREIRDSGLVEIGAHTVNHKDLSRLGEKEQRYQLEESKIVLEKGLGTTVTTAAYPFGKFNTVTKKLCKEIGFKGCVSVFYGDRPNKTDVTAWRRVMITGRELGIDLLKKIHLAFEAVK